MSNFAKQLRAKGKSDEDRYFAKRDRELLRAMHADRLSQALEVKKKERKKACDELEQEYERVSKRHSKDKNKLVKAYRKLLKRARKI